MDKNRKSALKLIENWKKKEELRIEKENGMRQTAVDMEIDQNNQQPLSKSD